MTSSEDIELLALDYSGERPIALAIGDELRVGVDSEGHLLLGEEFPTERHAILVRRPSGVFVTGHGASIGDEPVTTERRLEAGDVLRMGPCSVKGPPPTSSSPDAPIYDFVAFHARLEEEAERALRYGRPLSVSVFRITDHRSIDDALVRRRVLDSVRRVDVVGWEQGTEVLLLSPETGEDVCIPARRVATALKSLGLKIRAGVARFPRDGSDAHSLLISARAAVRSAPPGGVSELKEACAHKKIGDETIVVLDPAMESLFSLIQDLAKADLPVLVVGETGVGKESVAHALHTWSPRHAAPMVSINCAAVPETLIESELFGHERGAFSGAVEARAGLFELAAGGTLLLDEITEASERVQAGLLRVIETRRVRRVGGSVEKPVDVRIVAATNRDPDEAIQSGRFRKDLYYRLAAAKLVVPALVERRAEILVLARWFLSRACERLGRPTVEIGAGAARRLMLHTWPGNVRELKHVMEYAAATVHGRVVEASHLPDEIARDAAPWLARERRDDGDGASATGLATTAPAKQRLTLAQEVTALERTRMTEALTAEGGNRTRAAALVGMPLRTFVAKVKKYELSDLPIPRAPARDRTD